ncbi:MAG: hypothetical protein KDD53_00885 [Bdellovibrionales bacterium]|nr:hypothetical protein [Bdellovibrionales bacterium]
MKRFMIGCLATASLQLFVAGFLSAQEVKMDAGVTKRKVENAAGTQGHTTDKDLSESGAAQGSGSNVRDDGVSNAPELIELHSDRPCADDSTGDCEKVKALPISFAVEAPFFKTTHAFFEMAWDTEYTEAQKLSARSPTTVATVAKYLVEPAVARGDAESKNSVRGDRDAMLQADMYAMLSASVSPTGQIQLQAYLECMDKRLRGIDPKTGAEGKPYTYYDAHTYCRGDINSAVINESGTAITSFGSDGFEYSELQGGSAEVETAIEPTLSGEAGDGQSAISLSQLWSRDDKKEPFVDGSDYANLPPLVQLRRDVIEVVGDVVLSIKTKDVSGTGAGPTVREGSIELKDPKFSPDEVVNHMMLEVWNRLAKVIAGYCAYDQLTKSLGTVKQMPLWETNFYNYGYGNNGLATKSNWGTDEATKKATTLKQDLEWLSLPGFAFNIAVLDLFVDKAKQQFKGPNALMITGEGDVRDCGSLGELVGPGESYESINEFIEDMGETTVLFHGMHFVSKWIAMGRFINMLHAAERDMYQVNLKLSPENSAVIEMALNRLYAAAKTSDLEGARVAVARQLQEFLTYEFTARDNRSLRAVNNAGGIAN